MIQPGIGAGRQRGFSPHPGRRRFLRSRCLWFGSVSDAWCRRRCCAQDRTAARQVQRSRPVEKSMLTRTCRPTLLLRHGRFKKARFASGQKRRVTLLRGPGVATHLPCSGGGQGNLMTRKPAAGVVSRRPRRAARISARLWDHTPDLPDRPRLLKRPRSQSSSSGRSMFSIDTLAVFRRAADALGTADSRASDRSAKSADCRAWKTLHRPDPGSWMPSRMPPRPCHSNSRESPSCNSSPASVRASSSSANLRSIHAAQSA